MEQEYLVLSSINPYDHHSTDSHTYLMNNSPLSPKTSLLTKTIWTNIIVFSLVALLPTLRWYKEKYGSDKIINVDDSTLDELYHALWYDGVEQRIVPFDDNDVDTGHIMSIAKRFQKLYDKLSSPQQAEESTVHLRYPVQVSQYSNTLQKEHRQISYILQLGSQERKNFEEKFNLSPEEANSLFIILMHLSATEHVERLQLQDNYTQLLTQSGCNRVDLRGNVWWVLQLCERESGWFSFPVSKERLLGMIQMLQQHYHQTYANDILYVLHKDIRFHVAVKDELLIKDN